MIDPSRRRLLAGLAVGLPALALTGAARGSTPALSPERLKGVLDGVIADQKIPGATVAIGWADGAVVAAASGCEDIEAGRRMDADAIMLAASIGKTFVAA